MCLLCTTQSELAVLCPEHEKEWEASPEHRRFEAFKRAEDPRITSLHQSALADFVNRVMKERQVAAELHRP